MSKANILKRVVVLVLALTVTFSLAACGNKGAKTPYGSLTEKAYLKGDGFEISEKELYDEMKISGTNVLIKMFEEIIFKDELAKVKGDLDTYKEDLVRYANKAIFGESDIEKLKELKADVIQKKAASFADAMYLVGITVDASDVDTVEFTEHNASILEFYQLDVAKKIYAREKLNEDIKDKDSTSYIDKDKDIQSYFDTNVKNHHDLSSINIRFTNSFEANQTLRRFNIKASRALWYELPDPRTTVLTGYAQTVLESVNVENNGAATEEDYEKYYNSYLIDPQRTPAEDADNALTEDQVLAKFIEIYNYVYPFRTQIDKATYTTVAKVLEDLESLPFTKAYADYPKSQESLRSYIYTNLSTEENGIRFSSTPRSYGKFYYLAFKLKDHNEDILAQLEGDALILYEDEAKTTLKDYAQGYYDKIIENKLSDTYISTKSKERFKDADIQIHDELVHLFLSRSYEVKLAKKVNTNLIASVNGEEIKVDDFYQKLDKQFGVSVAIDLSLKKSLLNSVYRERITSEKMAEFKKNVENMIKQFGQGNFAQSGFPQSMGRRNFLRLAFRSETIDQAVEKIYVTNEVENAFLKDYEAHFGEGIWDTFAMFANRLQKQFFSISSAHLLISVDMNEDESPDKPHEFFETLEADKKLEYETLVLELMGLIHDKASQYSSFATGLDTIAKEYASSGKYAPSNCDTNPTPECTWSKYKQAGLEVMYQSLTTLTNQTNSPDKDGGFDKKFYEREIQLYKELKEDYYDVDGSFPSQKLDKKPATYDQILETDFGWHLILATGAQVSKSAKFTLDEDTKVKETDEYKIYEHIEYKDAKGEKYYLNAYSATDEISANQVRIYFNEVDSELGLQSLPSKVKEAINAYLAPVKAKYTNNYTQLHILTKYLASKNYQFADAQKQLKVGKLLEINERQFLFYTTDNALFNELYADWFDHFK